MATKNRKWWDMTAKDIVLHDAECRVDWLEISQKFHTHCIFIYLDKQKAIAVKLQHFRIALIIKIELKIYILDF